jgi:hypothetical protein
MKLLFKPSYLNKFAIGIAEAILIYSRNSATSILLIGEVIRTKFYEYDIGSIVNAIQSNLHRKDFLEAISVKPSQELTQCLNEQNFEIFECKFFDYYWSRLPVLLKCNHVIHHGKRLRPREEEIEVVSRACFKLWADSHPDLVKNYTFSGSYHRFDKLTRWYVRSKTRNYELYNIEWLWRSLQELYPHIYLDNNIGNVTTHVLESCFPMFWNLLEGHYRMSLFYYANFGWFVGDLDTKELCDQIKASCEKI